MTARLVEASHLLTGFRADDTPVIIANGALAVEDGLIIAAGPAAELRESYVGAEPLGGPGAVVIPGLVNGHHHVGLTPLQLGSPDHPLELWFGSRLGLRDVDPYLDTLYSAFEMIASGVTTVQHLHSRIPGGVDEVLGTANEVLRAYDAVGMRVSYSVGLRDQNRLVYEADRDFVAGLPLELRPGMQAYFERFTLSLEEQERVFDRLLLDCAGSALARVQVAPTNLHWLSDRALEAAGAMAQRAGVPMHMHLLETPYQKAYAAKRTGGSAFAHIHAVGLTGPQLTIGHGVWMTEAEIELCAGSGTRLCHNCSSNLRLKSGVAPVNRFRAAGVPVALGIDEAGINEDRDMLQEMRVVLRAHREPGIDAPHLSSSAVLRMATEHGATTTPYGDQIGRLVPGAAADLVVLDWNEITYPYQNADIPLVDVLVQRAKAGAVKLVMVGGEVVYRDGRFTRVDRDAILQEIAAQMGRPLSPAEEDRRALGQAVFPYVRRFYDGYLDGLRDDPFYRVSGRD